VELQTPHPPALTLHRIRPELMEFFGYGGNGRFLVALFAESRKSSVWGRSAREGDEVCSFLKPFMLSLVPKS
jgi:hypothetical protein